MFELIVRTGRRLVSDCRPSSSAVIFNEEDQGPHVFAQLVLNNVVWPGNIPCGHSAIGGVLDLSSELLCPLDICLPRLSVSYRKNGRRLDPVPHLWFRPMLPDRREPLIATFKGFEDVPRCRPPSCTSKAPLSRSCAHLVTYPYLILPLDRTTRAVSATMNIIHAGAGPVQNARTTREPHAPAESEPRTVRAPTRIVPGSTPQCINTRSSIAARLLAGVWSQSHASGHTSASHRS